MTIVLTTLDVRGRADDAIFHCQFRRTTIAPEMADRARGQWSVAGCDGVSSGQR